MAEINVMKGGEKKRDQVFSIEQVRLAGTSEQALVAIRGKVCCSLVCLHALANCVQVYDVTAFASRHPGGRDFLMAAAGRDATAVFESFHDPKAMKVMKYVVLFA